MAESVQRIKDILEKIRDDAQRALTLLANEGDLRSLGWKCDRCGHVKHFTRAVPVEVARPCPKCGCESFRVP